MSLHSSSQSSHSRRGAGGWLARLIDLRPGEGTAAAWSFAYFFCLLCGYYVLRPLRDAMGIAGGVENLQWIFTGTFIVMLAAVPLYGWISARLPRRRLLPVVYLFFIANILVFYLLFELRADDAVIARAFFIWTSVFNLFVVSVFWSFMADLFDNAQARRLFGFIAAGGSAGAIVGPLLTAVLAQPLGPINLLLIAALFLGGALLCIARLLRWAQPTQAVAQTAIGGGALAGIRRVLQSPYLLGICAFIWLYTTLATFLYFQQAHIVERTFDGPAEYTTLFAWMDFAVNALTVIVQAFLTGRIIQWLGLSVTLALIPLLMAGGFIGLGLAPVLPVLIAFQVIRRAGNYAIARPAREVLFTVVDREAKYKAKNVIDTVVYRGGDAVSGWAFVGLQALGLGLAGIAWIAVPLAIAWAATGWLLGRKQEVLRTAGWVQPVFEFHGR